MTSREYVEWFDHAKAAFPSLHRLFDGGSEAKRRSQQWFAAFEKIKLAHAKAAIDAMVRGECKTPSWDWSQLPAAVVQHAIDAFNSEATVEHRRYYDGPTVRCPHCQDSQSGYVSVWNPAFLSQCDQEILACQTLFDIHNVFTAWKRAKAGRKYETLAMACCCESPAAVAKRNGDVLRFHPKRHCSTHTVAGLHEFLRDETKSREPVYAEPYKELDEWN